MATHYDSGDLLDRDTFMAYGPFHPTRLAISRQLDEAALEAEIAADEIENEAYEKGRREKNSLADELEAEVERLKADLSARPQHSNVDILLRALEWVSWTTSKKADIRAAAAEAVASYRKACRP